jgi:MFS transporter, Spinster family, sphingosine-1-phosphate transporter
VNLPRCPDRISSSYNRYVLGVLTAVYALNQIDQGLISLLLQPIQSDLHLTDTQLGFLTGIAFGLFYAVLGVPIARWSDYKNRVVIASAAIGLWGLTVMSCVLVRGYVQLIFARIAAGIGESGCMPATYSLVGDYFPAPKDRTRAMTIYMLAGPLAILVSFIAGGWLNEHVGWRLTFFFMGLPGLLMAAIVITSVKEPRTRGADTNPTERQMPSMTQVLRTLWRQHSSRHLSIAIVLLFTMGLGLSPWQAAFMMRNHGMQTAELGVWLGLIFGLGGLAGVGLGGYVAVRWLAGDERAQMRASAIMVAAMLPSMALFLLLPSKHYALLALILPTMVCNFFFGPAFALLQRLVVDEMRATTVAVVMLLVNLIGMGVGPQVVGFLSDLFKPSFGVDGLRYAMLIMSLVALWSAYHFWCVGRTVRQDLDSLS